MITREQLQQIRDALDQAVNGSLLRDGLNHDDDELSSIAARSDNAYTKVKLVCHVKRLGEALRILDAALSAPDQEPVDDDWTQEDGKHLHEPVTAPVAAPDPQPVAWRDKSALPGYPSYEYNRQGIGEPLYTAPVAAQQREWQSLNDEQVEAIVRTKGDELIDHIYEYGTIAEGTDEKLKAIVHAADICLRTKNEVKP